MDLSPCIFLLRVIDKLVHVALQRPITAGRVGIQSAPRLHGEVSSFLYRLDGEIAGRLQDDRSLAAHPGDNGGPVFVIMAPPGLTFLAAPTCAPPQVFFPSMFGLALLASGVIEVAQFISI